MMSGRKCGLFSYFTCAHIFAFTEILAGLVHPFIVVLRYRLGIACRIVFDSQFIVLILTPVTEEGETVLTHSVEAHLGTGISDQKSSCGMQGGESTLNAFFDSYIVLLTGHRLTTVNSCAFCL